MGVHRAGINTRAGCDARIWYVLCGMMPQSHLGRAYRDAHLYSAGPAFGGGELTCEDVL